jgi:predicted phosphodiesterase
MSPVALPARVGLIGDVHAEDERLAAALAYLVAHDVRAILCTGDIPDGAGSVTRCCELLREHGVITVRGNHERWFLTDTMRDLEDATELEEVSAEARAHLAGILPTHRFSTPLGELLLCHGLGANDMAKVGPDDYGYAIDVNDDLQELISDPKIQLVVNGHSHRAMVRHFDGLTVINAGTLKWDDEPGFLVLDFESAQVQMLRWDGAAISVHRTEAL